MRRRNTNPYTSGFSIPEVLVALLLFAMGITTLLHYQQALTNGFQQHWQRRETWRVAAQSLLGAPPSGWHIVLSTDPGPEDCLLRKTHVTGTTGSEASLEVLDCDNARQPIM